MFWLRNKKNNFQMRPELCTHRQPAIALYCLIIKITLFLRKNSCLFELLFYVSVNSYRHVETVN